MIARGRWLVLGLALAALALIAGRWAALLLADRWWAMEIAPAAGAFLTRVALLRLLLDAAAVSLASGWFVTHFLMVYRGIGSVQVPRHVGDLEIHEVLTPRHLVLGAILAGVVLGLVVGAGAHVWWSQVALAFQGVRFDLAEPLLGRDAGVYLAQVPLWRSLHRFAFLLASLGLLLSVLLYLLIGSLRWVDGRPAVSDHARRHLGLSAAALALALAWGYLLEPFELAGGFLGMPDAGWRTQTLAAEVLTGTAVTVALLSVLWAWRPRHALMAAGWVVLTLVSVTGHYVAPGLGTGEAGPSGDWPSRRRLEAAAFGLADLQPDSLVGPPRGQAGPASAIPSLWDPALVALMATQDSALAPALLREGADALPVWLLLTEDSAGSGGGSLVALADDRTTASGLPVSYRVGDGRSYPGLIRYLPVRPEDARPGAPTFQVEGGTSGIPLGGWGRRVVLAWALQAGSLLKAALPGARVAWRMDPVERVGRLAPFAEWSQARPAVVDGELVWLLDGYLHGEAFPLVGSLPWRGERVGAVQAALLATVAARGGRTRLFLRPEAGAWGLAWAAIAGGLIEPADSLPIAVRAAAGYPPDLLSLQARVLSRPPWSAGALPGRQGTDRDDAVTQTLDWHTEDDGPTRVVAFQNMGGRRISSLLEAGTREGSFRLRLLALDSASAPLAPGPLAQRWHRFPLFEQMRDSVSQQGAAFHTGTVRYARLGRDILAYQPDYGRSRGGRPVVVWLSVAQGEALGAGRQWSEAWLNRDGKTVSPPPGTGPASAWEEARGWMARADSALRAGDWAEFGRAFSALQRLLAGPPDHAK